MCNQFTWFGKFSEAINELEDEAERNALKVAIVDYGAEGLEPDLPTPAARALFKMMRDDIDNSVCARNRNKGGRPRKGERSGAKPSDDGFLKAPSGGSTESETGVSEVQEQGFSETENGGFGVSETGVSEKGKPNTVQASTSQSSTSQGREGASRKRFAPPALAVVEAYVANKGLTNVDPAAFYDFYESNGWKQSRGKPIVDWRAACRNWDRRQAEFAPSRRGGGFDASESEYADVLSF